MSFMKFLFLPNKLNYSFMKHVWHKLNKLFESHSRDWNVLLAFVKLTYSINLHFLHFNMIHDACYIFFSYFIPMQIHNRWNGVDFVGKRYEKLHKN